MKNTNIVLKYVIRHNAMKIITHKIILASKPQNFKPSKITTHMVLYYYCMFRLFERILSDNDVVPIDIEEFNYRAWHFISLFIDHMIQIYIGQKPEEINEE